MTDAQVSAAVVQVLRNTTPTVQISAVVVQALTSVVATAPSKKVLRTVGSPRAVKMKWPDSQWRDVELL